MNATTLMAALASVVLLIVGQTALKRAMMLIGPIDAARTRHVGRLVGDIARRWQVYVGFAAYVASAGLWIYVLSHAAPSAAYPFLALSYVGVAGAAVLVLGESITVAQCIGIALVVAGVLTVAWAG